MWVHQHRVGVYPVGWMKHSKAIIWLSSSSSSYYRINDIYICLFFCFFSSPPMGAIFLPLGLSCLLDPCRCRFITPFVFLLLLETIGSGLLVCVCVCNLAGESGVERRQVTRQSSSPISPTPLEKRKAAGGKTHAAEKVSRNKV